MSPPSRLPLSCCTSGPSPLAAAHGCMAACRWTMGRLWRPPREGRSMVSAADVPRAAGRVAWRGSVRGRCWCWRRQHSVAKTAARARAHAPKGADALAASRRVWCGLWTVGCAQAKSRGSDSRWRLPSGAKRWGTRAGRRGGAQDCVALPARSAGSGEGEGALFRSSSRALFPLILLALALTAPLPPAPSSLLPQPHCCCCCCCLMLV
jgi:hypothetical protein